MLPEHDESQNLIGVGTKSRNLDLSLRAGYLPWSSSLRISYMQRQEKT